MKFKVSEASGPVLDWMVAKCERRNPTVVCGRVMRVPQSQYHTPRWLRYSTDWELGGPIIEREEIELRVLPCFLALDMHPTYTDGDRWEANIWPANEDCITICGPTPLIAAMRCYVVSKLGDECEVPDELV